MPVERIQSVYTIVRDMDRAQEFYEHALGVSISFRDRSAWCQFKVGNVNFALSSPEEAAAGARGSVVVFETPDADAIRQRIEPFGGRHVATRDMGSHGAVVTFADPDNNLFQFLVPSLAKTTA
jgi:predicted enzyme related to lactoylglutathione lyase